MPVQTLKGFRDFLPEQARKRQYVINTLKKVFESYGFEPLETPALEYEDVLMGKYGEEGDKLMYRFIDNGERNVAMRYDQTVPLSRVVAQYQNDLPFPFKRYQIQPVWRAENTQRGRYREFLQCDIDTVGTTDPSADAEILVVVAKAFEALGFQNFKILYNDRQNFEGMPQAAITSIDKLKKIGADGVKKELTDKDLNPELLDQLLEKELTENLQDISDRAKQLGLPSAILHFEPTLARGLDYYTGLIFEVEIANYTVGSVAGGGRYDKLIGMFAGRNFPAVGLAFGFDRIMDAMTELDLFPLSTLQATTTALVTIFSPELASQSYALIGKLRAMDISAEIYLGENASLEKQLKYADKKGISYVLILGPEEIANETVKVRNMKTRDEKAISIEEVSDNLI